MPDLRGMGLSQRPDGGYDKKTKGEDMARLLDALQVGKSMLLVTTSATWLPMPPRRKIAIEWASWS